MAEELNLEHFDLGTFVDYVYALKQERDELRAKQPSQVGEAVAWHTEDQLTDKSATTYDPEVAKRWRAKGWPVTPLYTHPTDQLADGVVVSRELLDSLLTVIDSNGYAADEVEVVDELRTLLAKSEGVKP